MIEFRESFIALLVVFTLGAGFCAIAPSSWTQPLNTVTAAAAATAQKGVCHLGICR
jgi:hypothetical protein